MAAASKVGAAKPAAAASPSASAAPAASSKLPTLLGALKDRLGKNPGLAKEIGGTLQFKVGGTSFHVSPAGFADGVSDTRDATLTFADEDAFAALVQDSGKEQDLFQRGQIRVDGDVFVAKKIGFLNKLA